MFVFLISISKSYNGMAFNKIFAFVFVYYWHPFSYELINKIVDSYLKPKITKLLGF